MSIVVEQFQIFLVIVFGSFGPVCICACSAFGTLLIACGRVQPAKEISTETSDISHYLEALVQTLSNCFKLGRQRADQQSLSRVFFSLPLARTFMLLLSLPLHWAFCPITQRPAPCARPSPKPPLNTRQLPTPGTSKKSHREFK